jgi:hypothetical protein
MKKHFFTQLVFLSFIFLSACKTDEDIPVLKVDPENITFINEAASKTVSVIASSNWDASVDVSGIDWCTFIPQQNNLKISVTENLGKEIRETSITITLGGLSKRISVFQLGTQATIIANPKEFSLPAKGGQIEFDITANVEFSIINLPEWITNAETLESNMKTSTQKYIVGKNEEAQQRKAVLIIKDNDSDCQTEVTVNQSGDSYTPDTEIGIKDDIKVKITKAETSSYHKGGGEVERSFDGDYSTVYHSDWANEGEDYFPITLDYYFNNADEIDYFVYYPRPDNSKNGLFKETEIQVKHKGESNFTKIVDKDFLGSSTPTRVVFSEPLKDVSAIRFLIKSGAGDGQGFASCAEMEFYKKNPDNFDPLSLFTDLSCSELKQGVTKDEIENCENSFFKNIALYILKNTYPREFRIAEYRAYPHPSEDATVNKTAQYSLFDNPTGISVKEGDELIILVCGTGENYPVSIKIQNLDNPTGSGFNQGASYPLSEGVNKITAANKGLIYVMYHTTNFTTAPIVKIHFATGTVNGYFDGTKHTKEDWNRLIGAAGDKYFDVIGNYAHLTFPTTRFRNHTGTRGKELIDFYDKLVYSEMELEGMVKYDHMFRNRMYFCVVYGDAYMFASGNYTGYNDYTLSDLCDVSRIKNENKTPDAVWGPAHEVGHVNQTRPGFKWLGMAEVTNNLCSMYVQSTFGNPTRLQTESIGGGYSNRYEKGMNDYFVTGQAHNQKGEDVFCKLIPFWQLKLYLVNVLGKEDFYKDVYELIRQTPKAIDDRRTDGEHQLEFVKTVCGVAQLNLEDFFRQWGFLTEIDVELDDYGKGLMQVSKNQIDETVSYLRNNYPAKPAHKFEYITDNNVAVYQSGLGIVKGTASRNGQTFAINNWKNVVAYEIRDANAKVIFVSLQPAFKMVPAWQNGYKVYAVSPREEMEVTF